MRDWNHSTSPSSSSAFGLTLPEAILLFILLLLPACVIWRQERVEAKRGRPHYHVLLFGTDLRDQYQVAADLTESPFLNQLWPHGAHRLGQLTGASANYVAQYTLKKIGGQTPHNQEGVCLPPPFLRASLKPAIGSNWFERYHADLTNGYAVTNEGRKAPIPRTYKKKLRLIDPQRAETAEYRAAQGARPIPPQRLKDAEAIHHARLKISSSRHID